MLASLMRTALISAAVSLPLRGDEVNKLRQTSVVTTLSVVESLPVYGTIHASGEKTIHSLDLGEHFLGKIHRGRVAIINDSVAPISISQIISSCGCTLAQPSDDNILPGEKQYLLVQVTKNSIGNFTEDIDVRLAGLQHQLQIKGAMKPRVTTSDMLVFDKTGVGSIMVNVHDKSLDPESLHLKVTDERFEITGQEVSPRAVKLMIKRMDLGQFPDSVQIVPAVSVQGAEAGIAPLQVPIRFDGVVRAVPETVYMINNKPLRVFVLGDVRSVLEQIDDSTGSVELKVRIITVSGETVHEQLLPAAVLHLARGLSLTFKNEFQKLPKGDYTLVASCASINFSVKLRFLN